MIELRPYQQAAIEAITRCKRGIVVAPAGAGKTFIMAGAVSAVMQRRKRDTVPNIVAVAPTVDICSQIDTAFQAFDLYCKINYKSVCYATTDTESFRNADCVLFDECHLVGSDQAKKLMALCKPTCAHWALTATPERSDEQAIEDIIGGQIVYRVARDELVNTGKLTPCEVRMIDLYLRNISNQAEDLAEKHYRYWHTDEQRNRILWRFVKQLGITENAERNKACAENVNSFAVRGYSVLCLVASIEQGKTICKHSGAVMLHSSTPKRAEILEDFRQGKIKSLVCTSLADQGLDCPIASVLIMACGGKSAGKSEQRTGRVLRPYAGKEKGIIIDFMDSHHGMLTAQSWQRIRTYKKLKYKIT